MRLLAEAKVEAAKSREREFAEAESVYNAQARDQKIRLDRRAAETRQAGAAAEARDRKAASRGAGLGRGAGNSGADWTEAYRKWDEWEDPDEIAAREKAAEERRKRAARGGTACNHDHSAERAVYEMDWSERLDACRNFQSKGNAFFKEGQYQRASVRYHHAITYFEYAIAEDDNQQAELDRVRLPVYLNYAACMLRGGSLDDALNYCEQALRIDPKSTKALFRKAQALRQKEELDDARKCIMRALELQPQNGALRLERKRIAQRSASYKRNSQQMGAVMFGSKPAESCGWPIGVMEETKGNTQVSGAAGTPPWDFLDLPMADPAKGYTYCDAGEQIVTGTSFGFKTAPWGHPASGGR